MTSPINFGKLSLLKQVINGEMYYVPAIIPQKNILGAKAINTTYLVYITFTHTVAPNSKIILNKFVNVYVAPNSGFIVPTNPSEYNGSVIFTGNDSVSSLQNVNTSICVNNITVQNSPYQGASQWTTMITLNSKRINPSFDGSCNSANNLTLLPGNSLEYIFINSGDNPLTIFGTISITISS